MGKSRGCFWAGLGFLGAFAFYLWKQYSQRNRVRIPGIEGIENPEIVRAYNRIASLPQMALIRRLTLRRALNYCNEGHALDMGCGPGQLVVELALASERLFVTGIDLSEEALLAARARAAGAGVAKRVDFRTSDVTDIPLPDDSLDLVVCTLSLHHWAKPVQVFNEITRVLRPGGSYVIFDLRRDMNLVAWAVIWIATKFGAPQSIRSINEPMASRDAAYTPGEAARLLLQSTLTGWEISTGPGWLIIQGSLDSS